MICPHFPKLSGLRTKPDFQPNAALRKYRTPELDGCNPIGNRCNVLQTTSLINSRHIWPWAKKVLPSSMIFACQSKILVVSNLFSLTKHRHTQYLCLFTNSHFHSMPIRSLKRNKYYCFHWSQPRICIAYSSSRTPTSTASSYHSDNASPLPASPHLKLLLHSRRESSSYDDASRGSRWHHGRCDDRWIRNPGQQCLLHPSRKTKFW